MPVRMNNRLDHFTLTWMTHVGAVELTCRLTSLVRVPSIRVGVVIVILMNVVILRALPWSSVMAMAGVLLLSVLAKEITQGLTVGPHRWIRLTS